MTSNEVPHTLAIGKGITIWGDTTKLQKFLPNALPDAAAGPSEVQVTVPPTTVSRYPGDPAPYARKTYIRRVLNAVRAKFAATPGRAFTVEVEVEGSDPTTYDATQFTFVGAFVDLHAAFVADAAVDLILRSPDGSPYEITAVV